MSRIEAGDLRARTEPFPLEDLVDATLARMPGLLEGRVVTVEMRADLPPVEVDAVFIDQVLTNLLENAVKHAPPGTPIHVRAEELPDGMARITVEDGGPGVPPAALGRLFDKFYAGAAARLTAPGGAAGSGWPWSGGSSARWADGSPLARATSAAWRLTWISRWPGPRRRRPR